jgi:hypothetical protein
LLNYPSLVFEMALPLLFERAEMSWLMLGKAEADEVVVVEEDVMAPSESKHTRKWEWSYWEF